MKTPVFSAKFRSACRVVAMHLYGTKGVWAYETFDYINARYFGSRLPPVFIQWGLTPHGACLGWASVHLNRERAPIITLHPALIEATETIDPWGVDPAWLGAAFAFDVILHECIHVHIGANLGGTVGRSSHDCKRWTRQVNRIAPLLGFDGVRAGGTRCVRVPDPAGEPTVRGKLPTRVVRESMGNVPMGVVAGFPRALRELHGSADRHYRRGRLPDGAPDLGRSS